ncbi:MAG: amidinotransferase [Chromatiales bacterium]|jgi:hypothetical protein|nr:amidinotransferase [Chromatiales bacterium]
MVRPAHFGPNEQTEASNAFQQPVSGAATSFEAAALTEFDGMAENLQAVGVRLLVIDDTDEPIKPDAVFANNWVTTHANGDVVLFPLEAPSRRDERRIDIIDTLSVKYGFTVGKVLDLSVYEREGRFLEGTGSMVLDRVNRVAYAALSTRTHLDLLHIFANEVGYDICAFDTLDGNDRPIYHTNVMLAIGGQFVVICAAAIAGSGQREAVLHRLTGTGRKIIDITMEQMGAFAGNLLEVQGQDGEPFIVLSKTAHDVLTIEQRAMLQQCGRLLPMSIDTIERVGGGSVRCMLAEVFLPLTQGLNQGDSLGA